jgi:hypothetical protein
MADQSEAMSWIGKTVVDRDGGEVGPCTTVLFDDTGAPEWLGVDHVGVRRKLPAAGASSDGGRVRVDLTRAQVMEAPRLAETPPMPSHAREGRDKQVMGALAAVGALVVAFLTLRWLRQPEPEPTASERLLGSAREAAAKAAHGGASVLDRTVAVSAPAAVAAGRVATKQSKRARKLAAERSSQARKVAAEQGKQVGKAAAEQGRHVGKAAGKVAAEQGKRAGVAAAALAATAADEVGDLLGSGAEVGHRVGETLGEVPDALAASGKRLQKKWRKLTNRLVAVVALAVGYVAGSAAGRQRYEQIKQTAEKMGAMASSDTR